MLDDMIEILFLLPGATSSFISSSLGAGTLSSSAGASGTLSEVFKGEGSLGGSA